MDILSEFRTAWEIPLSISVICPRSLEKIARKPDQNLETRKHFRQSQTIFREYQTKKSKTLTTEIF